MQSTMFLKRILFTCAGVLATCVYAQPPGTVSAETAADGPDAMFVQQAGQAGLTEVELSKLAVKSAKSPQVRLFAQTMVQDHTQNNKDLAEIATHENIQAPTELDTEHAPLRDKLASLHGADFDRTYVDAMRADHQKMIDLLQSSAATVSTEELRTFIKNTLPVVQEHSRMARELQVE